MKNLLLTGTPGCGKSTAIAEALREEGLIPFCAGYHTARIFGSDGILRGFAHYPANQEIPVNITADDPVPSMFMDFSSCPPLQIETFLNSTLKLLIPREDTRLILMDEMGGRELETPEVREAFLKALRGRLPVIGVLKEIQHADCFAPEAYQSFRREINLTTDTEICPMDKNGREAVAQYVRKWLKEHCC